MSGEPERFTHLDEAGRARMVDVGAKAATERRAVARAVVRVSAETARAVAAGDAPKGDVLGVARIAGIQAAKRTSELIPLCHPLALSFVGVEGAVDAEAGEITLVAEARTTGPTGVEMEALTAASVAALDRLRHGQGDPARRRDRLGGAAGEVRRALGHVAAGVLAGPWLTVSSRSRIEASLSADVVRAAGRSWPLRASTCSARTRAEAHDVLHPNFRH